MKILYIILITIVSMPAIYAQEQNMDKTEAENLFAKNRFAAVWPYYSNLLRRDSLNPELNFKMGMCYLNSRSQKDKAIVCFNKAIALGEKENSVPPLVYKLLAESYYDVSDFHEAIRNYEKYEKILREKKFSRPEMEEVNQKMELCNMGRRLKELKEMMALLVNHKFIPKEKKVSLSNSEYSITSSEEQTSLAFTFKKPHATCKTYPDKDFFEDDCNIDQVHFPDMPKDRDTSNTLMETTVATSVDGQIILLYRNDKGEGNLYASSLNGNEWTKPERLNKMINNPGWEPNEFVSADGNTLYFSSAREGGFGGNDIYKSVKLSNGGWSKAINMGPAINTPYDEEAPFIHPDGKTLYFSSNRYRTKNGFDNFISCLSDSGIRTTPVNVGYPSKKQDTVDLNSEKEKHNGKENYRVTFMDPKKIPITMVKGKITDKDGKRPRYAEITVTNNETGEIAGIYNSNSKTGKYAFILPPGKNNNITFETDGYLFHSENVDISKENSFYKLNNTIEMSPIENGSKIFLNNIFFENEKGSISPTSEVELNKLSNLLNLYPKMKIELLTYVNKECTLPEMELAEGRMRSLTNYLLEKGADKENVIAKVYRMPKVSNKKKKENAKNEYETGRLELKILSLK